MFRKAYSVKFKFGKQKSEALRPEHIGPAYHNQESQGPFASQEHHQFEKGMNGWYPLPFSPGD